MRKEFLWMLKGPIRQSLSLKNTLRRNLDQISAWKRFWVSFREYQTLYSEDAKYLLDNLFPCLGEDTNETVIEPTYFYQDTWAFERILQSKPNHHIDIGSHHKFVALLSKVIPVTMVDIRPLSLSLDTLNFMKGSILNLPYEDSTIESLSSLCVIEHIGLGRYGDPLDINGTEKAANEIKRVIKPGGNLYTSVPLDDVNRTYFNAHRAFTEKYILETFSPFTVVDKKYIYGNTFSKKIKLGFGTGCYHFRKPLES